ncbi:CHAT domain-containing protein [Ahniella affigens]|nr:CHAT domain-containing protein [Ahniella affigens]
MKTINLELLRQGPSHNQLLSPLVPYLAVCDNHEATTLHFPKEHRDVLASLQALRYIGNQQADEAVRRHLEDRRAHELRSLGEMLGNWLGEIPGLLNALGQAAGNFIHARLVLSASELALLPFELAISPPGFPGPGQHALLQSSAPICLTRESRRAAGARYRAPFRPRILFVFADLPGAPVPYEAHVQALREAIDPWVAHRDDDIPEMLTILANPTLGELHDACASAAYTHVHLLAHGGRLDQRQEAHLTVQLPDGRGGVEQVTGRNLARALRPVQNGGDRLQRPVVVTLAVCDSGSPVPVPLNPTGDSILHALHEAGIPLVVGSQFPLTFQGSVVMASVLYEYLLAARDPRAAFVDLRRQLAVRLAHTHDWASIVCYVSLADDHDDVNLSAELRRLDFRLAALARRMSVRTEATQESREERARLLAAQVEQEIQGLRRRIGDDTGKQAAIERICAGTYRRLGVAIGATSSPLCRTYARLARDAYLRSYQFEPGASWVLTAALREQLSLTALGDDRPATLGAPADKLWMARDASTAQQLNLLSGQNLFWALTERLELLLLKQASLPTTEVPVSAEEITDLCQQIAQREEWGGDNRTVLLQHLYRLNAPPYRDIVTVPLLSLAHRTLDGSQEKRDSRDAEPMAKSVKPRRTGAPTKIAKKKS